MIIEVSLHVEFLIVRFRQHALGYTFGEDVEFRPSHAWSDIIDTGSRPKNGARQDNTRILILV